MKRRRAQNDDTLPPAGVADHTKSPCSSVVTDASAATHVLDPQGASPSAVAAVAVVAAACGDHTDAPTIHIDCAAEWSIDGYCGQGTYSAVVPVTCVSRTAPPAGVSTVLAAARCGGNPAAPRTVLKLLPLPQCARASFEEYAVMTVRELVWTRLTGLQVGIASSHVLAAGAGASRCGTDGILRHAASVETAWAAAGRPFVDITLVQHWCGDARVRRPPQPAAAGDAPVACVFWSPALVRAQGGLPPRRTPWTPQEVATAMHGWIGRLARGNALCGCVHRDIKTTNCVWWVTPPAQGRNGVSTPHLQLVDYGFAKLALQRGATGSNGVMALPTTPVCVPTCDAVATALQERDMNYTVEFRAPELLLPYTESSDATTTTTPSDEGTEVWAAGMVLLDLLTGAPAMDAVFHTHAPTTKQDAVQLALAWIAACLGWPDAHIWPSGVAAFPAGRPPAYARIPGWPRERADTCADELPSAAATTPETTAATHCADLLRRMLAVAPSQRATWHEVLAHPFWGCKNNDAAASVCVKLVASDESTTAATDPASVWTDAAVKSAVHAHSWSVEWLRTPPAQLATTGSHSSSSQHHQPLAPKVGDTLCGMPLCASLASHLLADAHAVRVTVHVLLTLGRTLHYRIATLWLAALLWQGFATSPAAAHLQPPPLLLRPSSSSSSSCVADTPHAADDTTRWLVHLVAVAWLAASVCEERAHVFAAEHADFVVAYATAATRRLHATTTTPAAPSASSIPVTATGVRDIGLHLLACEAVWVPEALPPFVTTLLRLLATQPVSSNALQETEQVGITLLQCVLDNNAVWHTLANWRLQHVQDITPVRALARKLHVRAVVQVCQTPTMPAVVPRSRTSCLHMW